MAGVVPGVDLSPIIDRQKIGAFHVKLIAIAFLVVMADGYDIGAAAFAAPALIREWHVAPEALDGMFSAGLFAGFFGPLILGWISDHYGRRTAIISGAAFFGLFTLASVLAQNLGTLIVLRFIAGVGISGVLPITTALVNEYSPRRVRATLFVLMFSRRHLRWRAPGHRCRQIHGCLWLAGSLLGRRYCADRGGDPGLFHAAGINQVPFASAIWSSFASSPSCNPGSHSIPIRHSPSVARKTARSSPIRRSSMVASLGLRQCSGSRMRSI